MWIFPTKTRFRNWGCLIWKGEGIMNQNPGGNRMVPQVVAGHSHMVMIGFDLSPTYWNAGSWCSGWAYLVAFFVARLLNTSESTWHVDAEFVRYDAASEQQNLEDTWLSRLGRKLVDCFNLGFWSFQTGGYSPNDHGDCSVATQLVQWSSPWWCVVSLLPCRTQVANLQPRPSAVVFKRPTSLLQTGLQTWKKPRNLSPENVSSTVRSLRPYKRSISDTEPWHALAPWWSTGWGWHPGDKDFHPDSSDNRFQDSATRRIAKHLRYSSCAWYATIIDTNTDTHRNRCRTDDGKYPNEFACNALSDVHVLETKNCQLWCHLGAGFWGYSFNLWQYWNYIVGNVVNPIIHHPQNLHFYGWSPVMVGTTQYHSTWKLSLIAASVTYMREFVNEWHGNRKGMHIFWIHLDVFGRVYVDKWMLPAGW